MIGNADKTSFIASLMWMKEIDLFYLTALNQHWHHKKPVFLVASWIVHDETREEILLFGVGLYLSKLFLCVYKPCFKRCFTMMSIILLLLLFLLLFGWPLWGIEEKGECFMKTVWRCHMLFIFAWNVNLLEFIWSEIDGLVVICCFHFFSVWFTCVLASNIMFCSNVSSYVLLKLLLLQTYVVGSLSSNGLYLLDFYPDRSSPCHVDFK